MIKITGDLDKAKKALETNVKIYVGQVLNGNDDKMKLLCQKHPDLFEWVGKKWLGDAKNAPFKNKMMKKSSSTKSSKRTKSK